MSASLPGFLLTFMHWNPWPHPRLGNLTGIIGTVAAICTTISLLPQLGRILEIKSARDISLGMFIFYSTGVLLWFVYGLRIHSLPVEIANGISLLFSITILVLKVRYDRLES